VKQGRKLLKKMRNNPYADWRIDQVQSVCEAFGVDCCKPKASSHYGVSHETQVQHLTIPAARPIKPIYIRRLVSFVDRVIDAGGVD
jgi:hypothetical protein